MRMKNVSVVVDGVTTVYEVPYSLTVEEVNQAVLTTGLEHVGGRPKR